MNTATIILLVNVIGFTTCAQTVGDSIPLDSHPAKDYLPVPTSPHAAQTDVDTATSPFSQTTKQMARKALVWLDEIVDTAAKKAKNSEYGPHLANVGEATKNIKQIAYAAAAQQLQKLTAADSQHHDVQSHDAGNVGDISAQFRKLYHGGAGVARTFAEQTVGNTLNAIPKVTQAGTSKEAKAALTAAITDDIHSIPGKLDNLVGRRAPSARHNDTADDGGSAEHTPDTETSETQDQRKSPDSEGVVQKVVNVVLSVIPLHQVVRLFLGNRA